MSIRWGQARVEIAALREYILARIRSGYSTRKIYDLLRDERRITMSRRQFYDYVKKIREGRLTVGTPDQYDPTETYLKHAKNFGKRNLGDPTAPKEPSGIPVPSGPRAAAPLSAPEQPRVSVSASPVSEPDFRQLKEAEEATLDDVWAGKPIDTDTTTDNQEES